MLEQIGTRHIKNIYALGEVNTTSTDKSINIKIPAWHLGQESVDSATKGKPGCCGSDLRPPRHDRDWREIPKNNLFEES